MNEHLRDKRVLVTGGAQGIGRALVEGFSEAGARVIFCDTQQEVGEALAARTQSDFYPLDVAQSEQLDAWMCQLLEQYGDLDIIVNNVGVSEYQPLTDSTIERFKTILDINLTSVFVTSRALARHRDTPEGRERYGRIINLSSIRNTVGDPHWEAYNASKGGVLSLTYSLALSLRDYNITVNCLSPGWIDTGFVADIPEQSRRLHPSRRVGHVRDIMHLVAHLCHPDSDFINGENIVIDGGLSHMIYDI